MTAPRLKEIFSCGDDGTTWIYVDGHVPRKRFVGALLAASVTPESLCRLDSREVVRLDVHQGYVHHVEEGVGEWCEAEWVCYFRDRAEPAGDEPQPVTVEPATWADVSEAIL